TDLDEYLRLPRQVGLQADRLLEFPRPVRTQRQRQLVDLAFLRVGLGAQPRVGAADGGDAERGWPADDHAPLPHLTRLQPAQAHPQRLRWGGCGRLPRPGRLLALALLLAAGPGIGTGVGDSHA